jgi:hypothetical protein
LTPSSDHGLYRKTQRRYFQLLSRLKSARPFGQHDSLATIYGRELRRKCEWHAAGDLPLRLAGFGLSSGGEYQGRAGNADTGIPLVATKKYFRGEPKDSLRQPDSTTQPNWSLRELIAGLSNRSWVSLDAGITGFLTRIVECGFSPGTLSFFHITSYLPAPTHFPSRQWVQ